MYKKNDVSLDDVLIELFQHWARNNHPDRLRPSYVRWEPTRRFGNEAKTDFFCRLPLKIITVDNAYLRIPTCRYSNTTTTVQAAKIKTHESQYIIILLLFEYSQLTISKSLFVTSTNQWLDPSIRLHNQARKPFFPWTSINNTFYRNSIGRCR
jgi:hypothetical protein